MSRQTLQPSPAMVEELERRQVEADERQTRIDARRREIEAELAERNRIEAEKRAVEAANPPKPKARPASPTADPSSLRPCVPVLIWAADVPVVLPDPMLPDARLELFAKTMRAIKRLSPTKPGEARRRATLLEVALGTTIDHHAAAWAPVRDLLEGLGAPSTAADLKALAGKKRWRDRPLADPKEAKAAAAAKKATDVKFSDSATVERARKTKLAPEPIYAVTPRERTQWFEDPIPPPKLTKIGQVLRDEESDTKHRLERFKALTGAQINAGVRLATDWERAALEPHMTANLTGSGGGRRPLPTASDGWAAGLSLDVMRARDEVHYAIQALCLGGQDCAGVVSAIVLRAESATVAASGVYADKPRASAYVATMLGIGLNLLAQHYKLRSRRLADTRSSENAA